MQKNPFERIEQMLEEAEREFSHARMGIGGEIATAAVDVAEWDGEFIVTCDLPGFVDEDIDLKVTDHTLHIHAAHKAEEEVEERDYIRRERRRTDVSRTIPLPEDIDGDAVSATYESGVLTVTLPKEHAEAEGARKIPIS